MSEVMDMVAPPPRLVQSLWRGLISLPSLQPTYQAVASVVAWKHGVSVADIRGPSRETFIVVARQEFVWVGMVHCGWSSTQVGRYLGGRDHTTILHARDRHQARIDAGAPPACTGDRLRDTALLIAAKHDVTLADIMARFGAPQAVAARREFCWTALNEMGLRVGLVRRFLVRSYSGVTQAAALHQATLDARATS